MLASDVRRLGFKIAYQPRVADMKVPYIGPTIRPNVVAHAHINMSQTLCFMLKHIFNASGYVDRRYRRHDARDKAADHRSGHGRRNSDDNAGYTV